MRDGLAALDTGGTAKEHHEKIALAEEVKGAAAGAQVMAATMLEADVVARRTEAGVRENNPSYGVGAQVALARRESPEQGRAFLGFSGRLIADLPFTLIALTRGKIGEAQARNIDRETENLPSAQRGEIDAALLRDPEGLKGLCVRAVIDRVRRLAYEYDSSDALTRLEEAKSRRYLAVFPARDAMMQVAGMLSVEDGLAIRQALTAEVERLKSAGDERTRSQIMADVAVDRITGRSRAEGTRLMVHVVMTDRTLFQGGSEPAFLEGYGTVPSTWARIMVGGRDPQDRERRRAQVSLKRLYTHPDTGALVGMDSRSRQFPKSLKDLIRIRDQYCRTPYCNAPIKNFDHVVQHSRGGPTSEANGAGRCASCNQTKEQDGWEEQVVDTGGRHTILITTPAGAQYTSTAPPLPGTVG
ncbi:HNH endonuclease [Paeniglutamicibacter quisquiliarum]|uniref:HNH endonuclease n=1 Tax=Paeniglutamicibacter quisquiliarum TaxID=2849498 RepID=UPI00300CE4EC